MPTRLLNSPQALSRPRVPIMIGGGGEKKTLRLVAKYADATQRLRRRPRRSPASTRSSPSTAPTIGRDPDEIERSTLQNLWVSRDGRDRTETPAQIIDRFGELSDAGAQHIIVSMPDVTDLDAIELVGASHPARAVDVPRTPPHTP